ncbi:hypothetical protein RUND412_004411 [Rhizina undulata]
MLFRANTNFCHMLIIFSFKGKIKRMQQFQVLPHSPHELFELPVNFDTLPECHQHFALCISGVVSQYDALVIRRQQAENIGIPEVDGEYPVHVPAGEENINPAIPAQDVSMNAPPAEEEGVMDIPDTPHQTHAGTERSEFDVRGPTMSFRAHVKLAIVTATPSADAIT